MFIKYNCIYNGIKFYATISIQSNTTKGMVNDHQK